MRNLLFLVFFLSGAAGLIYESIWSQYLKLFLGHSAYAQTVVLILFMGGMAIGAFGVGRISAKINNPLRVYAIVEAVIGLLGLLFHTLFSEISVTVYNQIIPAIEDPSLLSLIQWGLSGLFILPQSILMGMTFPLISASIIRMNRQRSGATLALLYFANSLGGVVGVLFSAFVLIDTFGLPGTIMTAGILNLLLAAYCWYLSYQPQPSAIEAKAELAATSELAPLSLQRLLLLTALITGAASFIYEVVWIRMLSLVLGSSTHAFELMLAAFILGLALGGLWIKKRIDTLTRPVLFLAYVQMIMGILAFGTLLFYNDMFYWMDTLMSLLERDETGYLLYGVASHGLALLIMLPATFCAGMTLPLITNILIRTPIGEKGIGLVYGFNTIGAIIGVIYATHLAMPMMGIKWSIYTATLLDFGIGFGLLYFLYGMAIPRKQFVAFLSMVVVIISLGWLFQPDYRLMSSAVFRGVGIDAAKESRVVEHADGKTATISVTDTGGIYSLRTNGKPDAAITMNQQQPRRDEVTMTLLGTIPLLFHPNAKAAANIGFGSGLTTHTLLESRQLTKVDSIEIEENIIKLSKNFLPRNERAFSDSRSHIIVDDAKTYFANNHSLYDIIVSQPSNPWISGVASLFSREFYQRIHRHLNSEGLLVQWIHLYALGDDLVASVLKALGAEFADYQIFAVSSSDIIIVATNRASGLKINPVRLEDPLLKASLSRVSIASIADIESRLIWNKERIIPLLDSYEIKENSDYYPVLDREAGKDLFIRASAKSLLFTIDAPIPLREVLGIRTPEYKQTNLVISPLAYSGEKALTAIFFRNMMLGERIPDVPEQSPYAVNLQEARSIVNSCSTALESSDRDIAVFQIMLRVVPYLRPEELKEIKLAAKPFACGNESNESLIWKLYSALSARDVKGMVETSMPILEDEWLHSNIRSYALMVQLSGLLALGEKQKGLEMYAFYQSLMLNHPGSAVFSYLYLALKA